MQKLPALTSGTSSMMRTGRSTLQSVESPNSDFADPSPLVEGAADLMKGSAWRTSQPLIVMHVSGWAATRRAST
jgi:hypothetical protein